MKAITFNPSNNVFSFSELPIPRYGNNDVLIKVNSCGLNPVDSKIVSWKSSIPNMDSNWVSGLDVSGHIVEVGKDVVNWKVGDRVLCHGDLTRPHGGFAEYSVQDSEILIPHPNVSSIIAAATPCAGWTAWRALYDKLRIVEHSSILITGGSGGVGSFAIQIASYFKLKTIIVSCSSNNFDFVKSLGATHVIDYKTENIVSRVHEITNNVGVEIAFDTVGGNNDIFAANSLAFEGQMVELVDVVRPSEYTNTFGMGLSFHQLSLGSAHQHGTQAKNVLTATGRAFSELLEKGNIQVPEIKTIGFNEVSETMQEILNQRTVGKIVLNT